MSLTASPGTAATGRPFSVLVLTSSLLTDRMLMYSGFLEALRQRGDVEIWAASASDAASAPAWGQTQVSVRPLPEVQPFREFSHNNLRRLNEYVWDYRLRLPSRLSMWRHADRAHKTLVRRGLRASARLLAALQAERALDARLESILSAYSRAPVAAALLSSQRPSMVLTMNPFWFSEPAVVAEARRLSIPVVALIPSWDNLSTKSRLPFTYDAYCVWSDRAADELRFVYPASREKPIYVAGPPQFDVFWRSEVHQSRADFCHPLGLDPALPIILYAIGSPNFIRGEVHGALALADRMRRGDLGDAQLLVRPHPIHTDASVRGVFAEFGPRVVVQNTGDTQQPTLRRTQDWPKVREWVNTFRHANVVVNLASTVTIDASLCDRPVVNLDFDPSPGRLQQGLIRDINHVWSHFRPIAESGGVWLADDMEAVVTAICTYLRRPELHRRQRRWVVSHVCQFSDGRSGERLAAALMDHHRLSYSHSVRSPAPAMR